MEIRPTITSAEQASLATKAWYHQRFDGCPFVFSYIVEAHARKEPRKENQEIDDSISTAKGRTLLHGQANIMLNFFFDGKTDYYIDTADNEAITQFFLEKSQTDPGFTKKFMQRWAEDEAAYLRMCAQLDRTDLRPLSNEELLSRITAFGEAYIRRVTSSSVIDGFALGSDHIIAEKIRAHLKTIGREAEYNTVFSILTAPVHISFSNEAEASLLRIAKTVAQQADLRAVFLHHSPDEIVEKLSAYRAIYDGLVAHQKKYYWLRNNYVDAHILSIEYFIFEIKQLLEQGHDLAHDLDHILAHPEENRKRKEMLLSGLHMPSDIVALLCYSEDFTHWQDERKKATFFATHRFTLLLDELARRTGFETAELKYLLPYELPDLLAGKVQRSELRRRMSEGFVTMVTPDVVAYLTGAEAARFYEKIKHLDVPPDISVIRGLPASLGQAVGIAKIVKSVKEVGKVNKGDILVAVMTRPDYVPAMKKAAAIVTNEGGLTCHAAIVSRELRLPCVIATKFATEALRDGDKIEVNADKGEVRILERAVSRNSNAA